MWAFKIESYLKFIQKRKGPKIAQTILQKKNEVRGFTWPDFHAHCGATPVKTVGLV